MRGWIPTGDAFYYQPTLGDNPTARHRGQPSGHQGKYWIGTYEKYQGQRGQKSGDVQGDRPLGTLTSASFTIPKGILSFLVGGGSHFQTRVELLIEDHIEGSIRVLYVSGRNTETMHRVEWNLTSYAGKTGRIRIVDESSEGWGHINVDDFRFSYPSKSFPFDKVLTPPGDKVAIPRKDDVQETPSEIKVYLRADKDHIKEGEKVRFEVKTSPFYRNVQYQFNFGDGTESVPTGQSTINHVYYKKGTYRAVVRAIVMDKQYVSNSVTIVLDKTSSATDDVQVTPEIRINLWADKEHIMVGESVSFKTAMSPAVRNVRYQFNFGDGTENAWTIQPLMDHVYYKKGTYRAVVSAIIKDKSYNSNPVTIVVDKPLSKPVAMINPQYLTVEQGGKAVFKSQSTHDPDARISEYWSGPGGQNTTGLVFEVDTNQLIPGRYEITLNISDNYKQTDRAVATLEILPSVKYKVITKADYDRIKLNQKLKLRASLIPDMQHKEYRFNFGDGTESDWTTSSEVDHVYPLPGIYRAFVMARSREQILATSNIMQIEVIPKTVYRVSLGADSNKIFPNESIRFTGEIQPGLEGILYQFDFGDGIRSEWQNDPVASHTYASPGTYNVSLFAKIGEEFFQSDSVDITVETVHIRAYLEAEPSQTEPDRTVIFKARLEPNIEKVEYRFIFGDGGVRDWSSEAVAEHIYSKPGNYHAYVVSRIDQRNVAESNPVLINVIIKHPQMVLWVGISVGSLVFFGGGYFVFSRIKRPGRIEKHLKPTIQVRPKIDNGVQQIEPKGFIQPDFKVRLRSVLDSGKQEIKTEGSSLIVDDRRGHG